MGFLSSPLGGHVILYNMDLRSALEADRNLGSLLPARCCCKAHRLTESSLYSLSLLLLFLPSWVAKVVHQIWGFCCRVGMPQGPEIEWVFLVIVIATVAIPASWIWIRAVPIFRAAVDGDHPFRYYVPDLTCRTPLTLSLMNRQYLGE